MEIFNGFFFLRDVSFFDELMGRSFWVCYCRVFLPNIPKKKINGKNLENKLQLIKKLSDEIFVSLDINKTI
jgi:predicted RNA-binding protein YlxR (DUF448 family)